MNLLLLPNPELKCPDTVDPVHGFGNQSFVGWSLELKAGKKAPRGAPYPDDVESVWTLSTEPVERPNIHYYQQAVQHGDLLPANEETARACGVPFAKPKAAPRGEVK